VGGVIQPLGKNKRPPHEIGRNARENRNFSHVGERGKKNQSNATSGEAGFTTRSLKVEEMSCEEIETG